MRRILQISIKFRKIYKRLEDCMDDVRSGPARCEPLREPPERICSGAKVMKPPLSSARWREARSHAVTPMASIGAVLIREVYHHDKYHHDITLVTQRVVMFD